jgi:dUTP pyrophosphatase
MDVTPGKSEFVTDDAVRNRMRNQFIYGTNADEPPRRKAYRDSTTMLAVRTDGDRIREPFRQSGYPGDCGLDLEITEDIRLLPGESANVPCGVAVALPPGTFGWICGRSSTWTRWGLWVMPGIIDEGWRGELRTLVYRPWGPALDDDYAPVTIPEGTRLAQLIVLPNLMDKVRVIRPAGDRLPESERGESGFGSTG